MCHEISALGKFRAGPFNLVYGDKKGFLKERTFQLKPKLYLMYQVINVLLSRIHFSLQNAFCQFLDMALSLSLQNVSFHRVKRRRRSFKLFPFYGKRITSKF